jgi:hypothetical protein
MVNLQKNILTGPSWIWSKALVSWQQNCLVSWPATWHIHFESTDYKALVKDQKGIILNKFLTSQTRDLLEKQRVTQPVKKCPLFCGTKTHSADNMKPHPIPTQAHMLGLLWTQNCVCLFQILIRHQLWGKRNKKVTLGCICLTNVAMEEQYYIFSVSVTLVTWHAAHVPYYTAISSVVCPAVL